MRGWSTSSPVHAAQRIDAWHEVLTGDLGGAAAARGEPARVLLPEAALRLSEGPRPRRRERGRGDSMWRRIECAAHARSDNQSPRGWVE